MQRQGWGIGGIAGMTRAWDGGWGGIRFKSAGANLEAYIGNNPSQAVDSLGLYQVDFHYYVIYFLLRAKCFTPLEAGTIAGYSQYVDDSPLTAPISNTAYGKYERVREFHFPGSSANAGTRANDAYARGLVLAAANEPPSALASIRLGAALHTYADTWSHKGFTIDASNINKCSSREPGEPFDEMRRDVAEYVIGARGHIDCSVAGTAVDLPARNIPKALDAANNIYALLPNKCSGQGCGLSWPEVKRELELAIADGATLGDSARSDEIRAAIRRRFGDSPVYSASFFGPFDKLYETAISARLTKSAGPPPPKPGLFDNTYLP